MSAEGASFYRKEEEGGGGGGGGGGGWGGGGVWEEASPGICLDFNSLKSSFLGFWVTPTG